jgi:demethylmenaquinone methyltransferase / 2-methoxy-6-polyprenyl-1,4-benzoquinol methylase
VAVSRRPGLQEKWRYVFDSLESIIPVYESGSSRISLFSDSRMRSEVVDFAVEEGEPVLDLGSGPGTMAKVVAAAGGRPILLDASRMMLEAAEGDAKVQAVFEHLPFRDGTFGAMVAGFSLRDSMDLDGALREIRRIGKDGARFAFCDLGKSDSFGQAVMLGFYIRVAVPLIGAVSGGRAGLRFGSLYDTYLLTVPNKVLGRMLSRYFAIVSIKSTRLGGSIVVRCLA